MRRAAITITAAVLAAVAWAADPPADIELPKRAQALRDAGVPPEQVKEALEAQKNGGVKAEDASEVFKAEKEKIDGGEKPMDNFGAFVKAKVAEGVKGKDLAAAIHAEHAARGMGKPTDKGPDGEHGKPDDKGPDGEHGKPDDKGPDGEHGKPDDKPKGPPAGPGERGNPGGKPEIKGLDGAPAGGAPGGRAGGPAERPSTGKGK